MKFQDLLLSISHFITELLHISHCYGKSYHFSLLLFSIVDWYIGYVRRLAALELLLDGCCCSWSLVLWCSLYDVPNDDELCWWWKRKNEEDWSCCERDDSESKRRGVVQREDVKSHWSNSFNNSTSLGPKLFPNSGKEYFSENGLYIWMAPCRTQKYILLRFGTI